MLAFIQAAGTALASDPMPYIQSLSSLGVGGALAVVIYFKSSKDSDKADARYEAIAKDFRSIVTENTASNVTAAAAIQRVGDLIELSLNGKASAKGK